jgi:hypothetical protein
MQLRTCDLFPTQISSPLMVSTETIRGSPAYLLVLQPGMLIDSQWPVPTTNDHFRYACFCEFVDLINLEKSLRIRISSLKSWISLKSKLLSFSGLRRYKTVVSKWTDNKIVVQLASLPKKIRWNARSNTSKCFSMFSLIVFHSLNRGSYKQNDRDPSKI